MTKKQLESAYANLLCKAAKMRMQRKAPDVKCRVSQEVFC